MTRKSISVIAIMKNEEANIAEFLRSADRFADEIIINDTGSTDSSIELAISHPKVTLFESRWLNDFSEARNRCLEYVTGDFVVWLDLDDRVYDSAAERIRILAEEFDERSALFFKLRSLMNTDGDVIDMAQLRMFPANRGIYFENPIHEHVMNSLERQGITKYFATDVEILHLGYKDPELNKKKCERNIRILNTLPDGYFKFYNLAISFNVSKQYTNALQYFLMAEPLSPGSKEQDKCIFSISNIYLMNDMLDEAVEWYQKFNEPSFETMYLAAEIEAKQGQYEHALEIFEKVINSDYEVGTIGIAHSYIMKRSQLCIDILKKELSIV